jgi:hypothetical protein
MFKRDTSFSQIGCTGIGLSAADAAFLRDMQFHVGVGSIVVIRKTEKWGVPLSRQIRRTGLALPSALATLVKLFVGLQPSLTKLFSPPKDREAVYR